MTDSPDEVNEFRPYGHAQATAAELGQVPARLDEHELSVFTSAVVVARSIFVAGAGRTGLVMRCFAMRLMHPVRERQLLHRCGEEGVVR